MKLSFEFFAPKPKPKLSIAIPSSLLEDCSTLREKTIKLGLIGRACSIFRVEEVLVFRDFRRDVSNDAELIKLVLEYLETPQYLRKRLFKRNPNLRFVGLLPPLRTPHHPLASNINEIPNVTMRDGVIVKKVGKGYLVDVGLESPLTVVDLATEYKAGDRVSVLINKLTGKHRFVDPKSFNVYWGFKVRVLKRGLKEIRKRMKRDLVIATSRRGWLISNTKIFSKLKAKLNEADHIIILFGSPRAGLFEISTSQGLELSKISDFIINFIPHQGTFTVRTEEAIFSTLSIINLLTQLRI